jgi:hypothetical protein
MQATIEPKLSDVTLFFSDVKYQVAHLSKRLEIISPTKSTYEQSPIGTKAFERAMENLGMNSDEIQDLPKRNPRRLL